HGPLLATLLLEEARRAGLVPKRFAFRATAPVFADEPFETSQMVSPSTETETGTRAAGAGASEAQPASRAVSRSAMRITARALSGASLVRS
ncbi:MAG: hypothetical protein AAFX62_15245, partial [Pseudomonadota bacterium]